MAFVSSNIVLILGILGAAITLVASLTKAVQFAVFAIKYQTGKVARPAW